MTDDEIVEARFSWGEKIVALENAMLLTDPRSPEYLLQEARHAGIRAILAWLGNPIRALRR